MSSLHTPNEIESILNRLSIYQGAQQTKCASELENVAQQSNLHRIVTPSLMTYILEFVSPSRADCVIKAACLVLANSCTTDDLTNCKYYLANGVSERCGSVLSERGASAACVFAVLDVVATLCTGCRDARDAFRPLIAPTLSAVKNHKTNLEIHFACVCALATQTLADPLSSLAVARNNGLQILVEIYKWSAKQREAQSRSQDDHRLALDTMKWAKQALMNVLRCPASDVDMFCAKIQWGTFGTVVAIDELKICAGMERKKILAAIQQGPSGSTTSS
ncbi:Hypothetical protein, putative [Bodo saltans]|uniref:Uncharacterized protein n=1 Tax=Bodo saltans TaxID=75058 RepID=A0A0S4JRE0_BODSA|nr:Hypothetical protein, putative [Bodo saltans]|eukprot:CUG93344.1 Hypothetical protein, putative [Bodo saltans]